MGLADLVPDLDPIGLVLGKDDPPLVVLLGFQEDIHHVADFQIASLVRELIQGNFPLGLISHVNHHVVTFHLDDRPSDDLTLFDVLEGFLVDLPDGIGIQGFQIVRDHRHSGRARLLDFRFVLRHFIVCLGNPRTIGCGGRLSHLPLLL